ncbi:MAG TPA: patatin-like phospholipase family protein [Steroidobacteraceae bacterium]|nr:patatin-like phospholipase family protein [Steroidobacteraceae bacterium]
MSAYPPRPSPIGAPRLGLVLPGGGARAAYQVGVLKGIAELVPRDVPLPFRVISGTSAGAIIATIVAAHAAHFRTGIASLERFWRNFHVEQVYRADAVSMLRAGSHWLLALLSGGFLVPPPRALFDNRPLRDLLERHVNFARVRQHLEHGHLDALAINASAYRTALSVAFYTCAREAVPWQHTWRLGRPAELGLDHLMASAAVPFLFPPVYMGGEYYGDGAMRQLAPLSPAINLGANRLLVIGVRPSAAAPDPAAPADRSLGVHAGPGPAPSFGQIFGFMLDTLFMDGLQSDLERLHRDNLLIEAAGSAAGGLRRIEVVSIMPRIDFGPVAERHVGAVPRALRVLLSTIGAANPEGRTLLSYLLFEGCYARELIALGYEDVRARREELQGFMRSEP